MTPEERKLASDLVVYPDGKRRISPEEFARCYPSALERGHLALRIIVEAVQRQSVDELQAALTIGGTFGFTTEHVPGLCRLLQADWHFFHESIVFVLQRLKDSRAVDAVYGAAFLNYDYLAYDEFFGLARKCTWALADIGTADAFAKLQLLAASDNPIIAGYAQKRIDNWEKEQNRKKG